MDEGKYRRLAETTWNVAVQQHKTLEIIQSTLAEILGCLNQGRQPTAEQLRAWSLRHREVTDRQFEVSAAYEAILEILGLKKLDS